MSACGDFAEHVWKPGSCKNCFHPHSAHRSVGGSLGGGLPAVCLRPSLGGEEEDGVTAPSPYSKPTIAVKPTMMTADTNEVMIDVNMNVEQVRGWTLFCRWFLFGGGVDHTEFTDEKFK